MKITSTFLMVLLFACAAYAQEQKIITGKPLGFKAKGVIHPETLGNKKVHFGKANAIQGWYSHFNGLYNSAPNKNVFQNFVNFIFPDTNVIMTDEGDTARYWQGAHSYGQAVDPKDEAFDFQDPPVTSSGNYFRFADKDSYTIDSVAFPYIYIRNIEEQDIGNGPVPVVDTMVVEFYKGRDREAANATYGMACNDFFAGNGDTNVFARPMFDPQTKMATTVIQRITIPLTQADTTGRTDSEDDGWRSEYRTIPVGATMNAREVFGYSVYFKPGSVYSLGDTIVAMGPKKPAKRTANYLGLMFMQNQSNSAAEQIPQGKYYNNMYWIPSGFIYDIADNRNGWDYGFVPGSAYANTIYMTSQFYITGNSTLSVEEQKGIVMEQPYPNPVNSGATIYVPYKMNQPSEISLEMMDILGKQVRIINHVPAVGANTIELSTNGIPAGVYLINMKVGNEIVGSKKINVIR